MPSANEADIEHWITEYSGMTENKIRALMSGWKQHAAGWIAGDMVLQRRRDHVSHHLEVNSPLLSNRAIDFYSFPLTVDSFVLFDFVWNHYQKAGAWPSTWLTHRELGKVAVTNARKDLNHAFLVENPSSSGQIYELQILGVLLTSRGVQLQELLERYIGHLRDFYPNASEHAQIPSSEFQVSLKLEPAETKLLGNLIDRLGLGSHSKLQDGTWIAYLPRDIEDFSPEMTPADFLKSFLNRRYNHLRAGKPTNPQFLGLEAGDLFSPKATLFTDDQIDRVDELIVKALKERVPLAAASYEQALRDLADKQRASYRGPAADMRESLRETLDHYAPDDSVTKMEGYKQDPQLSGPTMKQKVSYILRNRGQKKELIATAESATATVDEIVGAFVRSVYTRSNISAHGATDRQEVLRLRQYVRISLMEILEVHV